MSANPEQRAVEAAFEPAPCIICGSTRTVSHFRGGGAGQPVSPVSERYRITHSERQLVHAIRRCVDCQMVSLPLHHAPPLSYEDAADPYYLEQAPQRIANAHRLLEGLPKGGRLLEIGCACGFLLVAARERGFTVEGVELSAWASGHARETYGLAVTTGTLETLAAAPATYDAVVMADVIEHLPDPRRTVAEINRLLRPGGRLLLLTPDVGSITARLAGPRWWGLLDDHYYYFSRDTLRRMLESEGYAVERITSLGRVFPLSHWLFKLAPYSRALEAAATRGARALGLDQTQISINLGDQMSCVAQKK